MWSQCWEIIVKGIRSLYFSVTRERIGSRRKDKMKYERKSMRKRDGKGLQFFKKNGKETHLQSFNTKKKHLKQVLWQQHQDKTRKKALSFQKSIISPVDPKRKTHQLIHEKDGGYITTFLYTSYIGLCLPFLREQGARGLFRMTSSFPESSGRLDASICPDHGLEARWGDTRIHSFVRIFSRTWDESTMRWEVLY